MRVRGEGPGVRGCESVAAEVPSTRWVIRESEASCFLLFAHHLLSFLLLNFSLLTSYFHFYFLLSFTSLSMLGNLASVAMTGSNSRASTHSPILCVFCSSPGPIPSIGG